MITKKYYKLIRVSHEDSGYLRLKNVSSDSGLFSIVKTGNPTGLNVEYSTDGLTWTTYDFDTLQTVAVGAGNNIYIRGNNPSGLVSGRGDNSISLRFSADFELGGNICSILDKTNYSSINTLGVWSLGNLFRNNTHLVSAEKLSFGVVTTLQGDSGWSFGALINLFRDCIALTTPPDLSNITNIGSNGIWRMFQGCENLVTPLNLQNVVTISNGSLGNLYNGCSKLSHAIAPNVQYLGSSQLENWLVNAGTNVPSGTTKVVNVPTGATITTNSTSGIPTGWTRVDY